MCNGIVSLLQTTKPNNMVKTIRCPYIKEAAMPTSGDFHVPIPSLDYHQWQWAVLHLFVPSGRKGSAKVSVSTWAQFALIGYSKKGLAGQADGLG